MLNRRSFMKSASVLAAGSLGPAHLDALGSQQKTTVAMNDHIQIALIGAGGQGQSDTGVALQVPGTKLIAVVDCYQGRLDHAREVWGKDVLTTRDYREVLARKDIDAVIIATPDHWHKQAAIDAMRAGKDVYLEKPMIHLYADGPEIIEAQRSTGRILQVGSQRVSSALYIKAKELSIVRCNRRARHGFRALGQKLRHRRMGLHHTARCETRRPATGRGFLAPRRRYPFNPNHFFQWRKWKAYGSGVAGDLFVHLFSGTNFVAGSHGPTRAMATGGLRGTGKTGATCRT